MLKKKTFLILVFLGLITLLNLGCEQKEPGNKASLPDSKFHQGDVVSFRADPTIRGVVTKVKEQEGSYSYEVKFHRIGLSQESRDSFLTETVRHYEIDLITAFSSPTPTGSPASALFK